MAEARVTKPFSSPRFGNCAVGKIIESDVSLLRQMEAQGLVRIIEEKKPQPDNFEAKPLPSSPAGQALSGGNASTLETKPEPSPPTQATKQPHGATSSMDATPSGGTNTTTSSRKRRKGGRKAGQRRTSTD